MRIMLMTLLLLTPFSSARADGPSNQQDFDTVLENGLALQNLELSSRSDAFIVLAACSQNGLALQYASTDLQNDSDIVLVAVEQNGLAFQYASSALKSDRAFGLQVVQQKGKAFQFLAEELRADGEIILAAVANYRMALEHVDAVSLRDLQLMLKVVAIDGLALEYAAEELKKNKDIVVAAVQQNSDALKFSTLRMGEQKKIHKKYGSPLAERQEEIPVYPAAIDLPLDDKLKGYHQQLKSAGITSTLRNDVVSDDGHSVITTWLTLFPCDSDNALRVLRSIYNIPSFADYPVDPSGEVITVENPNITPYAWTDQFTTTYNEYGEVISFVYEYRGEGGGVAYEVQREERHKWTFKEVIVID